MFARTILAISLGCAISSVVNAENTVSNQLETIPANKSVPIESYSLSKNKAAQPVTPTPSTDNPAVTAESSDEQDQVDASAVDSTPPSVEVENTPQQDIAIPQQPATPQTTAPITSAKTTPTTTSIPTSAGSWSLDALNNAEWSSDLQRGQFPIYAKTQVLLNRKHASPGAIDGTTGKNTLKAISTFQTMNNLSTNGVLDEATWQSLNSGETEPAFIEYTITAEDLKGPYAQSIPANYAEQAKMKGLYYTRVTEMLGEKFHMDENFLKKLNPKASFKNVGEKIIVANVRNELPEDIHLIIAHKGAKQLYLFNSKNKMIASFPATIGSTDTPSPTGTYTIKNIAPNPWYGYNPKNFVQGGNMKPLSLPPGPNNPVGNMWIGLSKPSFGIHGTPNPSTISKTASHGCIRLTNWDANDLAKRVKTGITVKFLE